MPFLIVIMILTSGCSLLGNLEGALTLKAYSAEQDAKEKEVKKQNANYELLKKEVLAENLAGLTQQSCLKKFGQPIMQEEEQDRVRYVYRPYGMMVKEKIYVFFDHNGYLIQTDYIEDK